MMNLFGYDWKEKWTASKAEQQLDGFFFAGPGWYFQKDSTLLVLPIDRHDAELWHSATNAHDELFHFFVWDNYDPTASINLVANAPTRMDSR